MNQFDDSAIDKATDTAPEAVRQVLDYGILDTVVATIGKRHGFHVDVIGTLAVLTRDMVIGLRSPADLSTELSSIMSKEEGAKVIEELNTSLMAPLREYVTHPEREITVEEFLSPPEVITTSQTTRPTPLISAPTFVAPQQLAVSISASPKPAPRSEPTQHRQFPIVPQPLSPTPQPMEVTHLTMRTMEHDVEAMKDGHAPAPYTHPVGTPTPVQPITAVLAQSVPTSVSTPTIPSPPSPGALPVAAPRVETPPPHPTRTLGEPDPKEIRETLQKYGIDPYREPPE